MGVLLKTWRCDGSLMSEVVKVSCHILAVRPIYHARPLVVPRL